VRGLSVPAGMYRDVHTWSRQGAGAGPMCLDAETSVHFCVVFSGNCHELYVDLETKVRILQTRGKNHPSRQSVPPKTSTHAVHECADIQPHSVRVLNPRSACPSGQIPSVLCKEWGTVIGYAGGGSFLYFGVQTDSGAHRAFS